MYIKLRPSQLKMETRGKIFKLTADSTFLIIGDGTVATPEEDGSFNSLEMDSYIAWTVSGNAISTLSAKPSLSLGHSSKVPVSSSSPLGPRQWRYAHMIQSANNIG